MVEIERIELSFSACKTDVFPLYETPVMVCLARFELATSVSQIRRSTKLSYRQKVNQCKELVAETRIELAESWL